jgi:hypothetical protein
MFTALENKFYFLLGKGMNYYKQLKNFKIF